MAPVSVSTRQLRHVVCKENGQETRTATERASEAAQRVDLSPRRPDCTKYTKYGGIFSPTLGLWHRVPPGVDPQEQQRILRRAPNASRQISIHHDPYPRFCVAQALYPAEWVQIWHREGWFLATAAAEALERRIFESLLGRRELVSGLGHSC